MACSDSSCATGAAVGGQGAAVDRHVVVARTADVEPGGLDLARRQSGGLAQQRRGVRDRQHRVLVLHREPLAAADAALERVGALAEVHAEVARALARQLDRADDGRGVRPEADAAMPADLVTGERAGVDLHAVDARGDGHALDLDLDGVILRRPVVEGQSRLLGQRDRGDRHRPSPGSGRVRLALRVVEVHPPVRVNSSHRRPRCCRHSDSSPSRVASCCARTAPIPPADRCATGPPDVSPVPVRVMRSPGATVVVRGSRKFSRTNAADRYDARDDRLLLSDADESPGARARSGLVGHDDGWTPASPPKSTGASTSAVPIALIVVCCGALPPRPTVTTSPTDQFATLRTRTVRCPAVAATVVVVLPNGFAPTVQLRLSPHVFPIGSARISSLRPAAGSGPPRKRTVSSGRSSRGPAIGGRRSTARRSSPARPGAGRSPTTPAGSTARPCRLAPTPGPARSSPACEASGPR